MGIYHTLFEKRENKLITGTVGMFIITAMLAIVFFYEANAIEVADLTELQEIARGGEPSGELVALNEEGTTNGYTNENDMNDETITIDNEQFGHKILICLYGRMIG